MDREQCCARLSVHPSRALVDEKFVVLVQNVPSFFKLTVHAFHQCEKGNKWESFGHYVADVDGIVNVSQDPCLGGTYSGVEPMGLLCSFKAFPGTKPGSYFMKKNPQTPMEVRISVYEGHQTEGFVDQVPMACVDVERWYVAPGVRRIPIKEDGFIGALFLPPGPGPFPGVMDQFGFRGGITDFRSALLASHGFAAMTVDYMTPIDISNGLKVMDFDYFEKGYRILREHPQVDSDRVGMIGQCIGGAITLRLACYSPIEKPKCVVCVSTTNVMPVGSSFEQWLRFFQSGPITYNEDNLAITRTAFLGSSAPHFPSDPSLKTDVSRLDCPLLLVVGEDDQGVPTYESAMDMKKTMESAGKSHLLNILTYPKTGHALDPPYVPNLRQTFFYVFGAKEDMCLWGGEAVAHCQAQEDAWKKILAFLRKHLCGSKNPCTTISRL